tara:strand:- start:1025 stop:2560 length:1536 start_codon:yes stop_codon:yes gene_type:complete
MRLNEILSDRRKFIGRLKFEDMTANVTYFNRPFQEQVALINALSDPQVKTIVVLKPRQIGISTANCADTFYEAFTAKKPLRTLVAADHSKTTKSLFGKFVGFYEHLPKALKDANPFRVNRVDKTLISERTGALIDHMTARGDAHGRGWTYQRLIAEELAFWTHAEEVWAGLRSTLHEGPDSKIIIVSTPNGPGNFFHERVLTAMRAERQGDKSIRFIFSKWSDHSSYSKQPPPGWEPFAEDWELGKQHGLSMQQLYWRHEMVRGVEGIGERRFRREYPLTVEDGFIVLEGCWFDIDYLNECFNNLPKQPEGELRIFEEPQLDMDYVIGVDPSWCSGGDFAVGCVMDETGEQVAVLSMNQGGEDLFAKKLSDLARYYHRARVLCEANTGGAGRIVIKKLMQEGIPIWKDSYGKDWITHRGNKEQAYAFARQMVNSNAFVLSDSATIQELMHIRDRDGKIEGQDGYHDDHSDALVLACWALRTCPGFDGRPKGSVRSRSKNPHPMQRIKQALR